MTAQACIRCGSPAILSNFVTTKPYTACKSRVCGHIVFHPAPVEPSAVIIPAGQDCPHMSRCDYAIAHGCIIARVYEVSA